MLLVGCGGRIVSDEPPPAPDTWCTLPDLAGPDCYPAAPTDNVECTMPDGTVWDVLKREAWHFSAGRGEKLCEVSREGLGVLWRKGE